MRAAAPTSSMASGPAATVTGGSGSLVFIAGAGAYAAGGGTGTDTLYGGSGANSLTGGAGANSILVAGTGNATLSGGAGSAAVMFGGPSTTSFLGSTAGSDTMVGGTGTNSFAMTQGDVAFGGPASTDTFYTGAGSALIVEGGGPTTVVLGTGTATMFAGGAADTYVVTSGLAAQAGIVGFKAGDRLSLSGFTRAPGLVRPVRRRHRRLRHHPGPARRHQDHPVRHPALRLADHHPLTAAAPRGACRRTRPLPAPSRLAKPAARHRATPAPMEDPCMSVTLQHAPPGTPRPGGPCVRSPARAAPRLDPRRGPRPARPLRSPS